MSYDGRLENGVAAFQGDLYSVYHLSELIVVEPGATLQETYAADERLLDEVFLNRLALAELDGFGYAVEVGPAAAGAPGKTTVPDRLVLRGPEGTVEEWFVTSFSPDVDTTPQRYLESLQRAGFTTRVADPRSGS